MGYSWDPNKARANFDKHKVDFADAVTALEDDSAVTIEDDNPDEERYITIGRDALGRILVIVYTYRDEAIRLISARKATARERVQYKGENL